MDGLTVAGDLLANGMALNVRDQAYDSKMSMTGLIFQRRYKPFIADR